MALSLQRYTNYTDYSGLNRILKERIVKERARSVIAIKVGDGDNLPENVIVEILSWLPVKEVLQFNAVCKSWYAIILSPIFVSKHLKNYYNNNNSDNDCLLVHYYEGWAELELHELLVDDTPRIIGDEVLYKMPQYGSYIAGPCDGIYYLYDYHDENRALWNPAINDLKVLPPIIMKRNLPSNLTYAKLDFYGFGYDSTTDDYKVVVIKGYWIDSDDGGSRARHPLSVLVYSLRTDSWRYWGDLAQNYDLEQNICYTVENRCFYWLGSCVKSEKSEVIISFDIGTNVAQEISVPDYDQPALKSLALYDDSLAFLAVHKHEKRLDIWARNNEGLWTKKFSMGHIPDLERPIGHWKKNKLIVECGDSRLVLIDPGTQEVKDLEFQMGRRCRGVFVYRESLLSVKDNTRWGHNENDETDANHV